MSKRGLSMDEKKVKKKVDSTVLEIFHETSEFFTLKELEKIAPKQKGIVQQTVKDVVEDLVGENLVIMDKIGTSNYFWSFPSANGAMKTAAVDKAHKELNSLQTKIQDVNAEIQSAQKGREDTPERRKLLDGLAAAQETSSSLKQELAAYGAADPVKYVRKKQATQVCKDAAHRWTDNVLCLIQWANSLGMDESDVRLMMGINDEWDDLPEN